MHIKHSLLFIAWDVSKRISRVQPKSRCQVIRASLSSRENSSCEERQAGRIVINAIWNDETTQRSSGKEKKKRRRKKLVFFRCINSLKWIRPNSLWTWFAIHLLHLSPGWQAGWMCPAVMIKPSCWPGKEKEVFSSVVASSAGEG